MSGFSLGWRFGLGRGFAIINAPYRFVNSEAKDLVYRFFTEPTKERQKLIDERWTALKPLSLYPKCDSIWVHAAHAPEAARLNWLKDQYNCLPINNPAFTADRGYMGNGSSSYLDTQFNPATAVNSKFKQNSGALGIRSNTDNAGTGSLAGFYDTAAGKGTTINPKSTDTAKKAHFRVNQGSLTTDTPDNASPSSIGMFIANRFGPTDMRGARNGVPIVGGGASGGLNSSEPSVTPANGNFRLGSIHATSFRACQFSMGFISGGLTNQEMLDFFNWFEPYRIALGIT